MSGQNTKLLEEMVFTAFISEVCRKVFLHVDVCRLTSALCISSFVNIYLLDKSFRLGL